MKNEMTGAEFIIDFLVKKGVHTISGIPGGANLPLYDALQRSPIRHVLARHEQGAGFIAQGMARATGEPGVCFASSGPGVTNLTTAIADAMMDSIPVLAITGQVPTSLIGTDAFQEVDAVGIMTPITKAAFMIRSVDELEERLEEAYHIMLDGRPGPVLVDVPKDIQFAKMPTAGRSFQAPSKPASFNRAPSNPTLSDSDIKTKDAEASLPSLPPTAAFQDKVEAIVAMLQESKRPLIYAGGGIVYAGATAELKSLIDTLQIPVALTLMGLSILPESHLLNLGMLGMHGSRSTNHAIEDADLILALGVRFDDRATGNVHTFAQNAKIVHIDIDASEIGKNRSVDIGLCADLKEALTALLHALNDQQKPLGQSSWLDRIELLRKEDYLPEEWLDNPFHPVALLRHLGEIAPADAIFTTDVGQHQMWAAQHLSLRGPRSFLTSGGAGTMGFGLPAAIGAALAYPERPVICITGDGSLFMNLAELSTAAELNLNIKVLVFNNNHLGLVRQQQDLFYQKNFFAIRYDRPTDYAMVARGMGFEARNIMHEQNVGEILEAALSENGPVLLNIPIDEEQHVLPMVPPGKANIQAITPVASAR
ncbi:MAG: biosynthetic-type acetolactate synthase large subunit [Leptonema illini]|uniref:Acetolactate synthase n=1 Tax=Leptonema illini TaxID=183 RepID=A0A833H452_9LEPT|nr:MAG: biosynthetic-type acetolactate synthase large subunit [Leptonema illini]